MGMDTMIGVDLAKSVFQVHGASTTGELRYRPKLSRPAFRTFMAEQPPAVVVLEACGSAHYCARVLSSFGHEVKLIAPHYVRPFVKRQKNDAADAEAIVTAAQRPEMRFVEPKSEAQQIAAILYRSRQGSWLANMMARKPRMLVAIALANKMERQIWAMLIRNENYKDPTSVMAA